jgi:hypothetical protein
VTGVNPAPTSGDLVTAVTANRDASKITGILQLRYVPSLDYVQVLVRDGDRVVSVDPDSVEVIERHVVPVERLEHGDPLVGSPGWRRLDDLDDAVRQGLVQPVVRDGLTWGDLRERMRSVVRPLVDAGWVVVEEGTEEVEQDCVVCVLRRGVRHLSVDHYADGWTFPTVDDGKFHAIADEDSIQIGPDSSEDEIKSLYRETGWI